jgi:uncharacterized membrane protein YhhN
MERNGLLAQIVLWIAILTGASYAFNVVREAMTLQQGGTFAVTAGTIAWKGAGVWLLAIYAALRARSWQGWLLVLVMGVGALGDVLVERNLETGAMAFLAGHIAAIILYLSMRRAELTGTQRWLSIVIVPAVMAIAWSLTRDPLVMVYAAFLAMMAASAWVSRFPRYQVGLGAMAFVASDLLIFAQMDVLTDAAWVGFVIWTLYFAGQVMITIGVTETLAEERR